MNVFRIDLLGQNATSSRAKSPRWHVTAVISLLLLLVGCHEDDEFVALKFQSVALPTPVTSSSTIGPAGGTATSPDGLLTLNIPAGALTSPIEIRITKTDVSALSGSASTAAVQFVYQLQPDGLTFNQPVVAQFRSRNSVTSTVGEVTAQLWFLGTQAFDGSIEVLGAPAINISATGEATYSGTLSHFSHIFGEEIAGTRLGMQFPASLNSGVVTTLDAFARSNALDFDDVIGSFDVDSPFSLRGGVSFSQSFRDGFSQEMTCGTQVPATAILAAEGFFQLDQSRLGLIDFTLGQAFSDLFAIDREPPSLKLTVAASSICQPFPEALRLALGLFKLTVASVEAVSAIGPTIGNLGGPDSSLVSIASGAGSVVVDLVDDSIKYGAINDSNAGVSPFGFLGVSQPNAGPATAAALLNFGPTPVSGPPFGGSLTPYLPDDGAFSDFSAALQGSFTDATRSCGRALECDEILTCTNGTARIIRYDNTTQVYDFATNGAGFAEGFDVNNCVSLVSASPGGPALSVRGGSTSRLYFADRSNAAQLVSDVGGDARRVRHHGNLAAITLFADDALQLVSWDGANLPALLGDPIPVGDGPVGLDLISFTDNSTLIVSAGFNDNSLSLVQVNDAGSILSNRLVPAPQGCEQPAHAIFIEDSSAPDNPYVVFTCFGSGHYGVLQFNDFLSDL